MKRMLILAGGMPGSGKTTFAEGIRHHLNHVYSAGSEVVIASADDYHVNDDGEYEWKQENLADAHKRCKRRVREAMAFETPVIIVHNTFTRLWERQEFHEMAKEFDYVVHDLVMLNTHGSQNIHGVPEDKLEQMARRFELPLYPKPEHIPGYGKPINDVIQHLAMVPQSEFWHPEGNVLNHTLIVMVRAIEIGVPELIWTALFHDLGKIETTKYRPEQGKITAYGHENVSVQYWDRFQHLAPDTLNKEMVGWLIANHMKLKYDLSLAKREALEAERGETWFSALELFSALDSRSDYWKDYLSRQGEAWEWLRDNVFIATSEVENEQ